MNVVVDVVILRMVERQARIEQASSLRRSTLVSIPLMVHDLVEECSTDMMLKVANLQQAQIRDIICHMASAGDPCDGQIPFLCSFCDLQA